MSPTARRRKQAPTAAAVHDEDSESEALVASTSGRQYPLGVVAWGILLILGLIILGMFGWRWSSTGYDDHFSHVGSRQSISSNGLKHGQQYAVVSPLKQEDHLRQLPDWMQSYIRWHSKMRKKYSDEALVQALQSRNATGHYTQDLTPPPFLLIRQCRKVCGGFNDRLGQLEWDVYVAYRTRRLLFLWWESSPDWTDLLQVPAHGWNLTMPQGLKELSLVSGLASSAREKKQSLLLWPHLKQEGNLNIPNWSQRLEDALEEDLNAFHNRRPLVKFRLTAHEGLDRLDTLLGKHGMARRCSDTYAHLFALAFAPVARIQGKIDATLERLMIQEEGYWALHLRTRYPPELLKDDKNMSVPLPSLQDGQTADESGLLWDPIRYPQTAEWILRQVYSAVVCMDQRWITAVNRREPRPLIYLLADSADVVKYLTVNLSNKDPDACTLVEQKLQALAPRFVSHQGIGMKEVLHLDKQRGRAMEAYDSILVDLFVASKAKRLAIGAGSFGSLAGKIGHLNAESILNYMDDSKCEVAIVK